MYPSNFYFAPRSSSLKDKSSIPESIPYMLMLYFILNKFVNRYLGRSSEQYVWHFDGFQIGRVFELQVTDPSILETDEDLNVAPQPRKDVTAS